MTLEVTAFHSNSPTSTSSRVYVSRRALTGRSFPLSTSTQSQHRHYRKRMVEFIRRAGGEVDDNLSTIAHSYITADWQEFVALEAAKRAETPKEQLDWTGKARDWHAQALQANDRFNNALRERAKTAAAVAPRVDPAVALEAHLAHLAARGGEAA